jgi:hypothetical protein
VIQSLSENTNQVRLIFVQVINNVREQSVEDLKSSIDLKNRIRVHELENQIEEVLPNFLILLKHSSGNFNK